MRSSVGLRLLKDVRVLVARGWTRGTDARNADGQEVEPWDPDAAAWSLLGGIVAVLEREAETTGEMPLEEVAGALYAIADVIHVESLAEWNDTLVHSQENVLEAIDRAIASYQPASSRARAS
jgi:hypothetical protein